MNLSLQQITKFLDTYLRIADISDDPLAVNGLQLEAGDKVSKIACAVDADQSTVEEACRRQADLLLVHHGLLWAGNKPMVGHRARKLARCFAGGLSVYSAHLPLDVHPECGNNVGLLKALGLNPEGTFGRYQAVEAGLVSSCDLTIEELQERLRGAAGNFRLFGAGPKRVRKLAVITGGGGSLLSAAAAAQADALITGEAAHYTALEAQERGMHLFLAGHYRTETFGVKALGSILQEKYGIPAFFIEHDTGL